MRQLDLNWAHLIIVSSLMLGVTSGVFAEAPECFYPLEYTGINVQVPDEYEILDVERISGRMIVSVSKNRLLDEGATDSETEVWFFRNFPGNSLLRNFENRQIVLRSKGSGGERYRAVKNTVSILEATAVHIELWEGSETQLFDLWGKAIEVDWPSIPEIRGPEKPDYVEPLTWIQGIYKDERSHKLMCRLGCEGGSRMFFATFELESGIVELLDPETLSNDQLIVIIQGMLRNP